MPKHSHPGRAGCARDRSIPPSSSSQEDVDRARKAAEALFSLKRPIAEPDTRSDTGTTQEASRKPRILSAVREQRPAIQPAHDEAIKPSRQHKTRRPRKRLPVYHLARLRTYAEYGMTARQAADMYGVSVSEIERMLRKA